MEDQKLTILWTSGERDVALKVVLRYIETELEAKHWPSIELIIWGPSVRLAMDDDAIREKLISLQEHGLLTKACIVCAEEYEVTERLQGANIAVDFVCEDLTHIIQSQHPFVSF